MPAEPSKDWKEKVEPGEDARLERVATEFGQIQQAGDRAAHASGFGCTARFEVLADLPDHARVGLFASPKTYAAYVRFSNGSNMRKRDTRGDVRGIAVKVVGAEGKKIIPGMEAAKTQDFLAITTPAIAFRTPEQFVGVVRAATGSPLLTLPRLFGVLGFGLFSMLPKAAKTAGFVPKTLSNVTFFSALPIQWGNHAAQFSFVPKSKDEPSDHGASLAAELADRLRNGALEWEMRARFFVDEASTPIEDCTVEWSAETEVPVARLTLEKQDMDGARGKRLREWIETLSFDPWHALEAHRPLGLMMRARNHAYRVSTQARKAAPEPDGTETFE